MASQPAPGKTVVTAPPKGPAQGKYTVPRWTIGAAAALIALAALAYAFVRVRNRRKQEAE